MNRILLLFMFMGIWTFQAQEDPDLCPTIDNENQSFCQSQGTGNNYYRPAVKHLEVTDNGDGVVWYDSASSTQSISMEEFLVDGEDYYAGNVSGTCEERARVVVSINNSPNAGATTVLTIASDAEPFDLLDVLEPSILGPADPGGVVTPPLASGSTIYDPAQDGEGTFDYEVSSPNGVCPDDKAVIFISFDSGGEDLPSEDDPSINCPSVEFTEQVFCESQGTGNDYYRPTVAHLTASANGDDIAWYDTQLATEPLSMDEILVDGEDYYAGNATGTCMERVRVDVVVRTSPNAGRTTFVTFCSSAGEVDLLDYLNPSILGEADRGGTIVPPLASGTTIFDPAIDAANQYEYHVDSPNEDCPADMAVIYVSVSDRNSAGDDITVQVPEDGGPVDLSTNLNATPGATITWTPPLASGTNMFDPTVDEAALYIATVSNDEGCEDDSAEVNVVILPNDFAEGCPVVEESTQAFCRSEGTGNNYYRPAVAELIAFSDDGNIAWYDTATSEEPLSDEEILVDGEDYYAGNISGTCSERSVVIVDLLDTPNAGATTLLSVNSTDASFDLVEVLEESILGPAQAGGTIDPPLSSGTTWFDPSIDTSGVYTYTVTTDSRCPSDQAIIEITVVDNGDSSEDDANAIMNVAMYPNPSEGNINLSVPDGVKPMFLRIYDLNGNTVRSMKLNSQSDLHNVDISTLNPSMYFAEIITDKGKVVKRILKN